MGSWQRWHCQSLLLGSTEHLAVGKPMKSWTKPEREDEEVLLLPIVAATLGE